MKLDELGLKTKPATKYFDHGYIKFSVRDGELNAQCYLYDDMKNPFALTKLGIVQNKSDLDWLMSIKTRQDAIAE